jgi:hypothetical protein
MIGAVAVAVAVAVASGSTVNTLQRRFGAHRAGPGARDRRVVLSDSRGGIRDGFRDVHCFVHQRPHHGPAIGRVHRGPRLLLEIGFANA